MASVQTGAGIVADSVPEREWEETENKARALLTAIGQAMRAKLPPPCSAMPFRLVSPDGDQVVRAAPRRGADVVGARSTSDVPVLDPTVSRRHAESLVADERASSCSDLGSSNGTFVNGERVEHARVAPGDVLTFGKLSFNVERDRRRRENGADGARRRARADDRAAARRCRTRVRRSPRRCARAARSVVVDETAIVLPDEQRVRQKLALLLEVSKALTRATDVDTLLEKIVEIRRSRSSTSIASRSCCSTKPASSIPSIARDQSGGEPRPHRAAVDRAQGDRGEGRDPVRQRAARTCASAGSRSSCSRSARRSARR